MLQAVKMEEADMVNTVVNILVTKVLVHDKSHSAQTTALHTNVCIPAVITNVMGIKCIANYTMIKAIKRGY